jgi:hypothetical protein
MARLESNLVNGQRNFFAIDGLNSAETTPGGRSAITDKERREQGLAGQAM